MKVAPSRLLPPEMRAYYLYGEDRDALFEAGEALLAAGDPSATRLRVDVTELGRIESESRNQGLFGSSLCYALVRNAEAASPKQTDHLFKLIESTAPDNRLILCAPEIAWKKALHKRMRDHAEVAQCEFSMPTPDQFRQWFADLVRQKGLCVDEDAIELVSERLCGLRLAARQLVERMTSYDGGEGVHIDTAIVGDMLGERAPHDLDAYCSAVAARRAEALSLLRRLVDVQQVAGVQLISWLGTRIQQLLLYKWYAATRSGNPLQKARVFGDARKLVPSEVGLWRGPELTAALQRIYETEKLLKGASVASDLLLLEQLTLALVVPGRLLDKSHVTG